MSVEIENLSMSFDVRPILKNVTFSMGKGELIALLGPNGAGKSTLMRCLLGLLKHYSGTICIDGKNVLAMSRAELAKKIAYIPQSAPAAFNYRVMDMVLMGATGSIGLFASPGGEYATKAMETIEGLGIGHLAQRGCGELSGGEWQLVLLARALIQDAKILVMDEPTANLDYGNQNRVMERVWQLAERGYTVMFSTHDPNQAMLYASRALTLWRGNVLTDGPPAQTLTEDTLHTLYGIRVRQGRVSDGCESFVIYMPQRSGCGEKAGDET